MNLIRTNKGPGWTHQHRIRSTHIIETKEIEIFFVQCGKCRFYSYVDMSSFVHFRIQCFLFVSDMSAVFINQGVETTLAHFVAFSSLAENICENIMNCC